MDDRVKMREIMRDIEDMLDNADIATAEAIRDFVREII